MPKAAQNMPDEKSVAMDRGVTLEVCQCSACGLVQLSNDPVPYYRDVIRAAAFSPEMKGFRSEQFKEWVQSYSLKRKKVIEIGCGRGEYLALMARADVNAYGVEHAEDSVRHCVENGLKVSQGFVRQGQVPLDNAPFDAFFILNFLEHLPDLGSVMRGISDNLADGAMGLVEVPNFDMIVQKGLFSEFIGDHLFYFTRDTLSNAFRMNGFDVVECKVVWFDYIISIVVKKTSAMDLSSFCQHQNHIRSQLQNYIHGFGAKRVAVWGAGHQALAILALANLDDRIRYVVDSADFKQGKYTPATHVPIVAPDALKTDPVDAVIVMAASYSDEVVRIIRQNYSATIAVSVLRDYGLEVL